MVLSRQLTVALVSVFDGLRLLCDLSVQGYRSVRPIVKFVDVNIAIATARISSPSIVRAPLPNDRQPNPHHQFL